MLKNEISILFFGSLTDVTGEKMIHLSGIRDTDEAIEKVLEAYPVLKHHIYTVALDQIIIQRNMPLPGDRHIVAFMPPFAGG